MRNIKISLDGSHPHEAVEVFDIPSADDDIPLYHLAIRIIGRKLIDILLRIETSSVMQAVLG